MTDEVDYSLTTEDLMRRWRVSRSTLCRRLAAGDIPAPFKVGCQYRWRVSDVLDHESQQTEMAAS